MIKISELILVKSTKILEKEIIEYRQEFIDHGEDRINGSCGLIHFKDFNEWLKIASSIESEVLSRDKVHASTYFSVRKSDNKIIGSIQLRHSLTEELERYGGHIGYGIRPSERMKGYATEQLSLALKEAKERNIPKVMISCNKSNEGSAKVIKNNGGYLKWEGFYEAAKEEIQIY